MRKFFLFLLFLITVTIHAQTDTAAINQPIKSKTEKITSKDTLKEKLQTQPLLHLITRLTVELNNLQLKMPVSKLNFQNQKTHAFTKEELGSGLSEKELIAYKENKIQLMKILSEMYFTKDAERSKSIESSKGIPVDIQGKILSFLKFLGVYD